MKENDKRFLADDMEIEGNEPLTEKEKELLRKANEEGLK